MPKWTVNLIGAPADLEALAGLDGGVVRDGADFVFRSADLDPLTEASAVEQAAVQRIEVLTGLLRVMTGDKRVRTVTPGGMCREEDGKKSYIQVAGTGEFEWQGGIVGDIRAWGEAALRDPEKVGRALQLFAGEPTPATLYKVFEVIESDVGRRMVTLGWTTDPAIDRFGGTIHSVYHLGLQARHGVQKHKRQKHKRLPDEKVMTVRQMRDFIRDLLVKWLESKRA